MEPLPAAPVTDSMRRFLALALVLLLVFRGLLGSAMAAGIGVAELPAPGVAAQALVQVQLHGAAARTVHAAALHADADAEAAQTAPCHGATSNDCDAAAHGPGCPACDICHSALLVPPAPPVLPRFMSSAVRPGAAAPFASAQAALAIKPPIL